jgi:TorA maturation chaperone TorD
MDAKEKKVIKEVLSGRADSYRLFSRLYLKPLSADEVDSFAAIDFCGLAGQMKTGEAGEEDQAAQTVGAGSTDLLAEGFNDMGKALRKRHTGTVQQLATDYTMCFDGVSSVEGQVCVPYASVFLSEKALLNQEPRQKVYRIFKAEGVKLNSGINLPEDHMAFELEFLAMLSERANSALDKGDKASALSDLELSKSFICDHILTWYDLLWQRALHMVKTRFYRGMMKAAKGYLTDDLTTLDDLIVELS